MRIGESPAAGGGAATAERIRDAAIVRFGRDGFSAGLRAVAADARVTAGLVVHHFGSKDGLRRACDAYVLEVIRSEKMKAVTGSASGMIAQLAEVEEYAPLALYAMRSMQSGGELATAFVEQMCRDAEQYLAAGVEAGKIKPSRDPAGRARYLTYQGMGALLLWMSLRNGSVEVEDFRTELRRLSDEITLPALELFTDGLFVDRSLLDDYLMYVCDPPAGPAQP
ncbi:TetR/AcrR family transcriptional regulator [Kribbella turkmenica]|uniref:TetR/AcrR family transcriptional regulator n=1 Tax=Kribbella turkmenica TaxID=2530375 RepID=A0A4R4XI65_9ACTN|nr:TetR family transcriptional regulator [Kribbella turkmenica]TDD30515.1 TetR/AcrR family transcriptional regulator [Kribbella turkmenica]